MILVRSPDSIAIYISLAFIPGGGGVLHQCFGRGVQHAMKKWTQSDLRFCKMSVKKI